MPLAPVGGGIQGLCDKSPVLLVLGRDALARKEVALRPSRQAGGRGLESLARGGCAHTPSFARWGLP